MQLEGGFEEVTKQRKWSKVSVRLGYQIGKNVGAILKQHYERLLFPFDVFKDGKAVPIVSFNQHLPFTHWLIDFFAQKIESPDEGNEKTDKDYKPHGIINRMAVKPPSDKNARRSKRFEANDKDKTEVGLQIYLFHKPFVGLGM